ncbi:MAG: C25 family peptidase C-terminal domain-containing protein [Candidatus Cloacimonetes bacterium]|nr:C25 family peptidase C-terminal domain-containing protein [Candidatus Cloacimonadota bacterium]
MNQIFGVSSPTNVTNFSHWCNLMGDPTMEVFVGIPSTYQITAPASIPVGYSLLDVVVTDGMGTPVANQCVTLSFGSDILATAYSDAEGLATLSLPSPLTVGTGVITVSGHNYKPLQQDISLVAGGLVPGQITINDDNISPSIGNNNGLANAGERIELTFALQNTTAVHMREITGTISCDNPYVSIQNSAISYGSILTGTTQSNASPVIVDIAPSCPDGTPIRFVLQLINLNAVQYTISEHLIVYNGRITIVSQTVIDGQDSALDPDEDAELRFVLSNSGSSTLTGLNAELTSVSDFVTIDTDIISYGSAAPSAQLQPSGNFSVYVNALCVPGMLIPMNLRVFNASGYEQQISLSFTVGNVSVTDPLGPDAYGYLIYDVGDTGYEDCPSYSWMGIAPAEGGSGTLLAISDVYNSNDEGDQVGADALEVVNLPFAFSFYGVQYNTITVCSNGFIALGETGNAEFRNFRIPGAMGPNPMIAGFWDDLATSDTGKVYSYYDSANHRFIVEWYRMLNGFNGTSEETFQIILYDHLNSSTSTGDGTILMQYNTFNNVDVQSGNEHGNYCTIGIEDHTGTRGLEYTFNNIYPTAAASLSNSKALYITTVPRVVPGPNMTIMDIQHSDTNGNGLLEPGETDNATIILKNIGDATATNVTATLSTTDPYVTITNATVNYGSIAALATANGYSTYQFSVSPSCPQIYTIVATLTITGSSNTWVRTIPIVMDIPNLGFGNMTVTDTNGDHDGNIDPGETAAITIQLNNSGGVSSQAGTVNMSCATNGITVTNGNAAFSALAAHGSVILTFNVTVSSEMAIGSLANLVFNATAGIYTASANKSLEIGAPTEITIGSGTSAQSYPIDRYYNYSAHEAIYLASEVGIAGSIKAIAFNKSSGSDVTNIEPFSLYMKNTSQTSLASGDYSLAGYTLVYNGIFPNNAASGWMEVNLDTMFEHNGIDNLAILCLNGFQQYTSSYPYWYYTSTPVARARQNHSDSSAPNGLTASNNLPNIRIKMFPDTSVLYPPTDLSAHGSNRTVALAWSLPIIGTPTEYNIYRNNSLLDTTTDLFYYDITVSNGNAYSYYVTAIYDGEESVATATLNATPSLTSVPSATIATESAISTSNQACPINIYYKSLHGQSVYTAAELNAAGVYGPININKLGFYIVSAPSLAMPNFVIRMKHTSDTNVSTWQPAAGMQAVYTNAAYMPIVGGYDMLTFNTPFTWNGTDNIVVDTAFGLVANYSSSGTIQYSSIPNGYRYARSDGSDQSNVFTGGSTASSRPNIKISVPAETQSAIISMPVTPLNFGSIVEGSSSVQQITLSNTGNQVLAGYITCPIGYRVELVRNSSSNSAKDDGEEQTRLGYRFTVEEGMSKTFAVTFSPATQGTFSGNLVVTSNSTTNSVLNRPLSGNATSAPLETPQAYIQQNGASVLIQWNTISNANHYEVWRSNSPEGPFTMVGTRTLPQYNDLSADKAFYYIKAISTPPAKRQNK